jgi:hypothetical protein
MGICGITSGYDNAAGTALYTLPETVGVASAAADSAATIAVITDGYSGVQAGLTAGTKYYGETGGLLTTDSNETPVRVAVAKDATEAIINIA